MFENSSNNGHRRSTFNFMGWVVKGKESPSRWPPPPFWEKFPKNTVFFGRPPLGKPSFKKKIYFAKKFHKTVIPPPIGVLWKLILFWGLYFGAFTLYCKKNRGMKSRRPPPLPFVKLFRKIYFFKWWLPLVKMSTKDTSFHSFFAFFSLLEKTETLDKKGDPHTKKGPL